MEKKKIEPLQVFLLLAIGGLMALAVWQGENQPVWLFGAALVVVVFGVLGFAIAMAVQDGATWDSVIRNPLFPYVAFLSIMFVVLTHLTIMYPELKPSNLWKGSTSTPTGWMD